MNSDIYKLDYKTDRLGVVFNSWENDFNNHYELKLSKIPGGWNGQMSKLKIDNWIKTLIKDLDKSIPNNSTVLKLITDDSNPYIANRWIQIRSKQPLDLNILNNQTNFKIVSIGNTDSVNDEICVDCKLDVSWGSGLFANRLPFLNDNGYLCVNCQIADGYLID